MTCKYIFCLALLSGIISISAEPRSAIAHLVSGNITGTVVFRETDDDRIHVTGAIMGMPVGRYGFHVHELGAVATCDAAGGHFNPDDTTHGGQHHEVRHVGDLGNVVFEGNEVVAVATINFMDSMIALRGANNILGRAVVLHELEDDYGEGNNPASAINGNAGPRVACAVIGVLSPSDPWNAAHMLSPSAGFIGLLLALLYYRKNAV